MQRIAPEDRLARRVGALPKIHAGTRMEQMTQSAAGRVRARRERARPRDGVVTPPLTAGQ